MTKIVSRKGMYMKGKKVVSRQPTDERVKKHVSLAGKFLINANKERIPKDKYAEAYKEHQTVSWFTYKIKADKDSLTSAMHLPEYNFRRLLFITENPSALRGGSPMGVMAKEPAARLVEAMSNAGFRDLTAKSFGKTLAEVDKDPKNKKLLKWGDVPKYAKLAAEDARAKAKTKGIPDSIKRLHLDMALYYDKIAKSGTAAKKEYYTLKTLGNSLWPQRPSRHV